MRARSSLYGRVSTRFAAYDNVEMERARSELQMHRSVCTFVDTTPAGWRPASATPASMNAVAVAEPDERIKSDGIHIVRSSSLNQPQS
ncbi:MAG: hypothetical protein ACLPH3_12310 [Terracidiphilus sp.]